MILVITSSFDKTIDYIEEKYNVKNFFRFNIDKFSDYKVSYDGSRFEIVDKSLKSFKESECRSIYYRKPTPEDLVASGISRQYYFHMYREVFSLIDGIVDSFDGRCLSKPSIIRKADNKIIQAKVARNVGFSIPKLIITNNMEFVNRELSKPIIKPLSSGLVEYENKKEFVQTNLVDITKDISTLKYSPAYFQEYQKKDFEVRVTVVEQSLCAVKIESMNKIDWRKVGNDITYGNISIPDDIAEKCLKYMSLFDIRFGCFDFIVCNNEWLFLEMNANGQWAWLEIEMGLNISSQIMGFLNHG